MADVYVQVNDVLRKDEATAARRVIVYPVTTAEVSTTEEVSKNGGALGASTAVQAVVSSLLCSLTIPAGDLDTLGTIAYKLQGATDNVFISGIRVSDNSNNLGTLITNVAAILADTGTDGVAIADGLLTAAKFGADFLTNAKVADDAFGAEHFAADWLEAAGLKTDAADKIADEVLKELIADHKATAGSLAEFVNFISQRAGAGKLITDTSGDTVKTYDTDGSTVLKTQTKSTSGTETTWTPS